MLLSCHIRISEWIWTLLLLECQGTPCSKQVQHQKCKWQHNRVWTHSHLIHLATQPLNHITSVCLWTNWLWVYIPLLSHNPFLYVGVILLVFKSGENIPEEKDWLERIASWSGISLLRKSPRDFEILGWCPVGPVLPHGEKAPLQPWLATLLVMVSQWKCLMG